MAFELPNLPYSMDALKPHLSAETLEYHHGKHHKAYVDKLNDLVKGTKFESASLEQILKTAEPGPLFNSGAQHWNHSFYWKSLSPKGGGEPKGPVADAIKKAFGSFRWVHEEVQRYSNRPLRERMGMAGAREGWLAASGRDS